MVYSPRWTALTALLATTSLLLLIPTFVSSSPASHGLDPMPRAHPKKGGAVGRKAAMGERSQWEVGRERAPHEQYSDPYHQTPRTASDLPCLRWWVVHQKTSNPKTNVVQKTKNANESGEVTVVGGVDD
jgi:hypothetical protein